MSSSGSDELSWHEMVKKKISHVRKEVDKESRGPDDEQEVENEVKQLIHQLCDLVLEKSDFLKEIADEKPGKISNDKYKKLLAFGYDIEFKKGILRDCITDQYAPGRDLRAKPEILTWNGETFGNFYCDEYLDFMCERQRLMDRCKVIGSFAESLYSQDLNEIEYAMQLFYEIEGRFSDEMTRRIMKDPKWQSSYDKRTIE